MEAPRRQITPERKAVYYLGMTLGGFGLLLFLSTFLTFALNFGNFDHFNERGRSMGLRAIGGMFFMMAGLGLMIVGTRGLAGSGIKLDPEEARKDIEPWARMSGGLLDDALSEVKLVKKFENHLDTPTQQIKIRCQNCQALNDEHAKFCNQCGAAV
jgi:hypothetical protein